MREISLRTAAVAGALAGSLAFAGPALAHEAGPLVDPAWLADHLEIDDLVVLDIRNRIDGGSAETFAEGHIPGAVYSNYIEAGWRATVDGVPGKLPPVAELEALIGGLGIDDDDHVVIVPGGVSSTDFGSAARVYWTFKVLGHDTVSILEGGHAAWAAADLPLATGESAPEPATFTAEFRPALLATTDQVAAAIDGGTPLVDARPLEQYVGEAKSDVVARAGTLPGAVNVPHSTFVVDEGRDVVDGDRLAALLAEVGLEAEGDQIAFCNTGHWASVGWFALSEVAGNPNVAMYDGSMVEWTADEGRPVATGLTRTAAN
ncbi:MAG: sulfurtransferase [Alphaproteobacteria bacterium]|jgi:thiosulfate/3-mercaptopyruvate sulfurtransferase|nr:sulfurtransferase [Alphaproteobacteria bacterium]